MRRHSSGKVFLLPFGGPLATTHSRLRRCTGSVLTAPPYSAGRYPIPKQDAKPKTAVSNAASATPLARVKTGGLVRRNFIWTAWAPSTALHGGGSGAILRRRAHKPSRNL